MRITMWLVSLATITTLAFSYVPGMADSDRESKFESLKRLSQVMELVRRSYVQEVSTKEMLDAAIDGMLQSLDPHSSYLDEEDFRSMQEMTSGEFFGVGIEITQDENGYLKVVAPIEDTPGWRAGLKAGDLIIEVNGMSTQDMSMGESISHIKGPKGTSVTLTILSVGDKSPRKVDIVRDTIPIISVKTRILDEGYMQVRMTRFSERTTEELYEKVEEYAAEHELKGIILDLRNNPGGLLDQAIKVSDAFLSDGQVVSIKYRNSESNEFNAHEQKSDITAPMVVLINAGSASASEIVAGALRDHNRALIIGERSFGKGSVQNIFPLSENTAVKLTIARYYTPNGTSIQAAGIEPDIVIPFEPPREDAEKGTHPILREGSLSGHLENDTDNGNKKVFKRTDDAQEALERDNQLRMALQLVHSLPRMRQIQ